MLEFEAGAIFGACLTVTLLILFMTIFGQDDEPPKDDEWNPWGGRHGR